MHNNPSAPHSEECLSAFIERCRTDATIPTRFEALDGCVDCERAGHCICWNWRDEAEFLFEFATETAHVPT